MFQSMSTNTVTSCCGLWPESNTAYIRFIEEVNN